MGRKSHQKTKTPGGKTPRRTSSRKNLRALKMLSYDEHLESNDISTHIATGHSSGATGTGAAVVVTPSCELGTVDCQEESGTQADLENVSATNDPDINIRIDKFVLNKKQNVKKKLSRMDDAFRIIAKDGKRQYVIEMSTPTYHIFVENFLNLGRKDGHIIESENFDEHGVQLKQQFNVKLRANNGKTVPITITCYHTNNSMLVQLKKSEHPIDERIELMEKFMENTVKKIVEVVERSHQYEQVKAKLNSHLLKLQHSLSFPSIGVENELSEGDHDGTTKIQEESENTITRTDQRPPHCVNVTKDSLAQRGYKSFQDWNSDVNHVYIGRDATNHTAGAKGSKWQNPFPLKTYGREECLKRYEEYLRSNKKLLNDLIELGGKQIGCWCKPSPCHGDILIKVFKELYVSTNPPDNTVVTDRKERLSETPARECIKPSVMLQGTPNPTSLDTPMRDATAGGVDLKTLITVNETVADMVSKVVMTEFPECVIQVDETYVRDIKFHREENEYTLQLLCNTYELFQKFAEVADPAEEDANTGMMCLDVREEGETIIEENKETKKEMESTRCKEVEMKEVRKEGEKKEECKKGYVMRNEVSGSVMEAKEKGERKRQQEEEEEQEKGEVTDEEQDDKDYNQCHEDEVTEGKCQECSVTEIELEELRGTVNEQHYTIKHLLFEEKKYLEELIQKDRQLKILQDEVKQLQDQNRYRRIVVELEAKMDENEVEIRSLENELQTKIKKIQILEESNEQLVEESRILKNSVEAKLSSEEKEKQSLVEELKEQAAKSKLLEDNVSRLMDENTILKKSAKVGEKADADPLKVEEIVKSIQTLTITMEKMEASNSRNFERVNNGLAEMRQNLLGVVPPAEPPPPPPPPLSLRLHPVAKSLLPSQTDCQHLQQLQQKKAIPSRMQQQMHQQEDDKGGQIRQKGNTSVSLSSQKIDGVHDKLPVVPGEKSYKEVLITEQNEKTDSYSDERRKKIEAIKQRRNNKESKTLIFASSITRDIDKYAFNNNYCYGDVRFHEFKGKKGKDIVKYMEHHLEEESPHTVVLVAGGNDLPNRDLPMTEIAKVANHLIEGGVKCKEQFGVTEVLVSSVLPRSHSDFQGNRHRMNNVLRNRCEEEGLKFIENEDIVLRPHGHRDGVHLNEDGSELLHRNLLFALNNAR